MVEKRDAQKAKAKQEKEKPEAPKEEGKPKEEKAGKVVRKPAGKPEGRRPRREEFRAESIIRLAETNLDATKPVRASIRRVSGVGFMFSNAVAAVCGFGDKKLGDLTEQERKKLEDILMHPENYNIPFWLCNRRKEPATGQDRHLIVSQLELTKRADIGQVRKLKTYKGVRHSLGLPVRGQRTRSSFRHERSVGVVRKAARMRGAGKKKGK